MKKNMLPLLLIASLLFALSAAPIIVNASPKPTIVAHLKGALEPDDQLKAIMKNMTDIEWVVVLGDLSPTDLAGADMLITVKADATLDYTDAELSAIKEWFDTGGKAIWVAADSDYGDDRLRQPTANKVLESVGSVLRIEQASIEDPVSSAGKPYRVLALSEKCDVGFSTFVVGGVTRALFHGPGPVIAYVDGEYVKLEEERPENVYRIMWSSSASMIVNNNPPDPEVHEVGEEGTFILMAMEIDFDKKNVVIATGDAPFDQYAGLYMPEIRRYERYAVEYPQEGGRLFENIIRWFVYYAGMMIDFHLGWEALEAQVTTLEGEVTTLEGEVTTLEDQVKTLEGQVTSLKGEKTTLEGRVTTLEGEKTTLEDQVKTLEDQITSLQASITTWQYTTAAAFVVGLIIGVAVMYAVRRRS
ncbi:MAG: hypothetical protein ACE5OW_05720 [Candidatus Bathyarchaeia archaeon]